jgi:ketosteroid isomerase-like protein
VSSTEEASAPATPRKVVEQMLEYGRTSNLAGVLDLMAPDGDIEWPYTPAGGPIRLRGRAEIGDYLTKAARSPIKWQEFRDVVVYETVDPDVIIVEYEAHGILTTTNGPFRQSIIAVFRVRDGHIVLYRDYLNPMALIEAGVVPPTIGRD